MDRFEIYQETPDLLVLHLRQPVTHESLVGIERELPKAIAKGPKSVLADRHGQEFLADAAEAVQVGQSLGRKLKTLGARVAVLNRPTKPLADVLAAQVHRQGVPVAQFEKEEDARSWLAGGFN